MVPLNHLPQLVGLGGQRQRSADAIPSPNQLRPSATILHKTDVGTGWHQIIGMLRWSHSCMRFSISACTIARETSAAATRMRKAQSVLPISRPSVNRHVAELLLNGVDFDPFQHRRPEQDLPYSEAYFEQMCVRDHDMISRDDFLHFYWDKVFHPHERVHYDEELSETVDDDDVTADHDSRDTPTDSSDRPWPTSTYLEDGVSGPSYHPGSYSPLQQRAQSVPGGRWIHEPFAFTPERRQAEPAAPVDSYANWKEKWLYAPETPLKPSRKAPRQARSDRVNRGAQMRAAWGKDRFLNGIADRKFDLRSCGHDGKFARQAACRRSNLLIPDYVPPHEKRRDGLRQRVRQNLLVPAFLPP